LKKKTEKDGKKIFL